MSSEGTDLAEFEQLQEQLRQEGFRFEGGYAISPVGKRTYVASTFDLSDLLEQIEETSASELSGTASAMVYAKKLGATALNTTAYQEYVNDYGDEFVKLVQRVARDEFTRRQFRLVTPEDINEYGEELIQIFRKAAKEVMSNRQLMSAQEREDYGADLIELTQRVAQDEYQSFIEYDRKYFYTIKGNRTVLTSLHKSAFVTLGATIRDDRHKIHKLAEDMSLVLDSNICTKARRDLTTPRNRLVVELAWLPGVSPNSAKVLVENLHEHLGLIRKGTAIPGLARANLLGAAFELLDPEMDSELWRDWIIDFAYTVENLDAEVILKDVNADRSVSGFPEVKGIEHIEGEMAERRRYYTDVVKEALDRFESMKLVGVVTSVAEATTEAGEKHAPLFVHELIDRYEANASGFLQPEASNIEKLIEAVKEAGPKGEAAVKPLVDRIEQVVRKWDAIAKPIQLSMRAQGLEHELSKNVASQLRSLAIHLYNEHDMLDTVVRMNQILQECFKELPELAETLGEDSEKLQEFVEKREEKRKHEKYRRSIEEAIRKVRNAATSEEAVRGSVSALLEKLNVCEYEGEAWDEKLNDDEFRSALALDVRSLAIDLNNKYELLDSALRISEKVLEVFFDLPDVSERLEKDVETLRGNKKGREESKQKIAQRNREITYEAEIGLVFKDTLRISPNGVEWKGQRFPLESITGIRWGAVRNSVNGIPTGTDYTIAFGDARSSAVVQTRREEVYEATTDRLWKAVGGRLIDEALQSLRSGKRISFGGAMIDDKGVQLTKRSFLSKESVYRSWEQVTHTSYNGSLFLTDKNDKKVSLELPYLNTWNAHLLEAIIRLSFKQWNGRLSGLLE